MKKGLKILIPILVVLFFVFIFKKEKRILNFPNKEVKYKHKLRKENTYVYIMAGQSNMAGRAFVEPQDTLINSKIFTINKNGEIIYAKEPIHFYEPNSSGLDLGKAFAEKILTKTADSICVLIIPTAVGGSSIDQWLKNKSHRGVQLLENFKNKVELSKKHGIIKGVLWHQGETDASNLLLIDSYAIKMDSLFEKFRTIIGNKNTSIVVGDLGGFSKNKEDWKKINNQIQLYVSNSSNTSLVKTFDLKDRGDNLHFDSKSIRTLGERYADEFLK